jgi:molybdenum cofactor cytidylyltransferase
MHDCVIAAAGASSRMGRPKQLLPFAASTMVETVVAAALEAGCRALLVVGHRGAEVAAPFAGEGRVLVVENRRWELGMLGSIQAALDLVRGEAFFVMNADMPLVPASAYGILAGARDARRRSGAPEAALFAASRGREGHPVLMPSAWIPEILGLEPGGRMRRFLDGRPLELVEAGTEAVLADIDTPEEYRRLARPTLSPSRSL